MKVLRNLLMLALLTSWSATGLNAQCQTWNDSDKKDQAENAHVVYRPFMKGDLAKLDGENFQIAFDNWKTAYDIAPAADGQRPSHYVDGRKLLKAKMAAETDAAKKKELADWVMRLYDEQMVCYKNEGYLMGRKGFDMFYTPGYGYSKSTFETLTGAMDKAANATEYIIYDPLGQVMKYLYTSKQLPKDEFLKIHEQAIAIADHNIENNAKYGEYYKSSKAIFENHFKEIEDDIFDCTYFKEKLLPSYKENPDDLEVIKYVYVTLRDRGCEDSDPEMAELKGKYETLAAEINAELEKQRRIDSPCYDGTQLQKEKKFEEALARYKECIESGDQEGEALAQIYYSMAFIQTWELGQYQAARANARKAASLKKDWGKPYILIGDMYSKTTRSCGDDWASRLAVLAAIEKYAYAKSIDADVADDANKRIGNLSGARPDGQEGFMRGVKAGQKATVPCWIGETVTIRFK